MTDVEQGFMPWLMERVEDQLNKSMLGRLVLDGMMREVVRERCSLYQKLEDTLRNTQVAQEAAETMANEKKSAGGAVSEPLPAEPAPTEPEVGVSVMNSRISSYPQPRT